MHFTRNYGPLKESPMEYISSLIKNIKLQNPPRIDCHNDSKSRPLDHCEADTLLMLTAFLQRLGSYSLIVDNKSDKE